MSEDGAAEELMAEKLALATDPLRVEMTTLLALRPATAAQLAETLEAPIERVRYQLKRLVRLGWVDVHAETTRRGAIERTYALDSRKVFFLLDELDQVSPDQRREAYVSMLVSFFREMIAAIRVETPRRRDDDWNVRIPLELDVQGWREVAEELDLAVQRLLKVKEASTQRLGDDPEEAIRASSLLFFFEPAEVEYGRESR